MTETTKPKVLLITEQPMWREALSELLVTDIGCEVLTSPISHDMPTDDTELLATVVIADSDTLTVLHDLKQENPSRFAILIVPDACSSLIDEHIASLPDHLINPPFVEEQLTTILKQCLETHRLRQNQQSLETALKRQQKINDEIELLKNAIVRNVSHELRTPLLHIKSAVSLLRDSDEQPEKLINYAERAVERLTLIISNITMLGHSLEIELNPIVLTYAVGYAKRNIVRVLGSKEQQARIVVNLEDKLPYVMADSKALGIAIQLLIDNALKFSEGQVEVIGRAEGDKVYVAVRDYGIGIPQSELKQIFNTFFQIDSSSTRIYGGTGVGLAIVKLILDHHNAEISVDSEEGEGSTFWFLLDSVDLEADYADD